MRRFVHYRILDRDSEAFQPGFKIFCNTSAIKCLEGKTWPEDLLVTADFARTGHSSEKQHLNSFLRPVHWVASRKNGNAVNYVVLSPYKAHALLPSIRQQKMVTLHVYSPRVSMSVHILEDLSFCSIPAGLKYRHHPTFVMQLNLFARQLYLRSYEEYLATCRFLGLCFRPPYEQVQVAYDGFISPTSRPAFDAIMERQCPFTVSPVGFLRMLMAFRRKGQNFQKSHLGRILHGELLARDQFQEYLEEV